MGAGAENSGSGAMDARRILAAKRDGRELSAAELAWFARGLADGTVSDAQAGAFAMAVLLNGMSRAERVALTLAMRDSGRVLGWDLPGPVLDKHSTGGVGDAVSLVLAPALAASGAFVPMISGRGLGHTGGTLDKLEAAPGVSTRVSPQLMRRMVPMLGCAIVAAGPDLAPADRRLYAIRDVTATVESLDLICASILSKKLAAGLDALVLDVKCGSGAFFADQAEARALAEALVEVATGAGLRCRALITDMDAPLARAAGNALELGAAIRVLRGEAAEAGEERLAALTLRLGGELLAMGGLAPDAGAGAERLERAIASGEAAVQFGRMMRTLGGPADLVERWQAHLPAAPVVRDVAPERPGVVAAIDTRALGMVVVDLGGGRRREDDRIDPRVGLDRLAQPGEEVGPERPLARVHAADEAAAEAAARAVRAAYRLAEAAPAPRPLVLGEVG